ncbi:interleukin-37 [Desmodus rotundus]|uniref:interleukin-37 n=1 Tax=Desmodus rotundus TaxID=9430 RepID=UPI002380CD27|nr:interleukin-37 [Desmodus rotundus]
MSFLEESTGVKMDSGDLEISEAECSSEDLASGPLEPGPSRASLNSAHAGPKVVTKVPEKFVIHDKDHKVLVLDSGTLLAVPDKQYIRPETFFTLPCRISCSVYEHKGSPIFLAVSKGDLCLCCKRDKKKNQPILQLKKQNLAQLVDLKEKKSKSFVFYRAEVGSRNTLESAAYSGWFICTSCNLAEPVGMTNHLGRKEYTDFSFYPVKNCEMSPSEISE